MVPSAVVRMDALPCLTTSWTAALPAPIRAGGRQRATQPTEILCGLFAEVLGLPRVGVDDSFFDLGGHSLLAAKLIRPHRDALGVQINVGSLFAAPTVARLAERLSSGGRDALDILLPLRTEGSKPPLFCVHPAAGLAGRSQAAQAHRRNGRSDIQSGLAEPPVAASSGEWRPVPGITPCSPTGPTTSWVGPSAGWSPTR